MRALCELVAGVYGPASRPAFGFMRVLEAMERMEQDLAAQAMRDFPGYPTHQIYRDQHARPAAAVLPGDTTSGTAGGAAQFLFRAALGAAAHTDFADDSDGAARNPPEDE